MINLSDFEPDQVLWRRRPTTFDRIIRKIQQHHRDSEEPNDPDQVKRLEDFLLMYRNLRNLTVALTVESVTSRRDYYYSGFDHHDLVVSLLTALRRFVGGMEDRVLSKELVENFTLASETPSTLGQLHSTITTLIEKLPTRPKYRINGGDIDRWCRYVRKMMGVYNVPRPIPQSVLDQQKQTQELQMAFSQLLEETFEEIRQEQLIKENRL